MGLDHASTADRSIARTAAGVACFVAALAVAWIGSPESSVVESASSPLVQAVVGTSVVLLAGTGWFVAAPAFTAEVVEMIHTSPGRSLGYGLLGLFLTAAVGGLALGTLAAGGAALFALPALLFVAVLPLLGVLGTLALARRATEEWRFALLASAVVGGLSYAIPYVGTLAWVAFVCAGLGATYQHVAGPADGSVADAGSGGEGSEPDPSSGVTVMGAPADDRYIPDSGDGVGAGDDGPERR